MENRSSKLARDPVTLASQFFVEFRSGDGTAGVRARFQKWLRSSPENVKAYLEIAAGWSELPTGDPEDRIDIQALVAEARDAKGENVVPLWRTQARGVRRTFPPHLRLWTLSGTVALLLVVLAGVGLWITLRGLRTYDTGIGEQRTLILADGSTVVLNALTTVRVHMTQEAREITLIRGQAYFHDTDEPGRPFLVRAGKSSLRAIGTEFDVDQEPDRTVVTVLAGQVAVAKSFAWIDSAERRELLQELARPANKLKAVLVSAGQQVTVLAERIPVPSSVNLAAVMAWREQRLVFDATPLEQVAQQFNLYSRRQLVIADPSLRNIGVSGEYSAADPSALIRFLRSQPTLKVTEAGDRFIVTKNRRRLESPPLLM